MNKNYNKFYNKPEMPKQETVNTSEEEKVCSGDECENCTCETPEEETVQSVPVKTLEREVGNCEYLNLREFPTTDSKVLTVVKRGSTLTLIDPISDDDKWVKVRIHKTGVEGFIMRDYTI